MTSKTPLLDRIKKTQPKPPAPRPPWMARLQPKDMTPR